MTPSEQQAILGTTGTQVSIRGTAVPFVQAKAPDQRVDEHPGAGGAFAESGTGEAPVPLPDFSEDKHRWKEASAAKHKFLCLVMEVEQLSEVRVGLSDGQHRQGLQLENQQSENPRSWPK